MKLLLLHLFSALLSAGIFYNDTPTLLKSFMLDAVDTKMSNTQIGEKYFCTNMLHRTDEYGTKAHEYLEFSLSNQRPMLRKGGYNIEKISFEQFDNLPSQEIPPKPFHIIGDTKNIYVGKYQGKIIIYFLVEENKIASTLFLAQGDEHYFVDFCH